MVKKGAAGGKLRRRALRWTAGVILVIMDRETADWIGYAIGCAAGGVQLT